MATVQLIKSEIKSRVNNSKEPDYSAWTIGIITEPDVRKEAHSNPKYWKLWEADSANDAREIETYFLNEFPSQTSKRMKGGTGGNMSPHKTCHVYIF